MAKEYIEREAAKSEFNIHFGGVSHAVIANRILDAIPAADVVEVKHGRWISDDRDVLFSCSECGTKISTSWDCEDLVWNFCPNCGAKMDGGAENE